MREGIDRMKREEKEGGIERGRNRERGEEGGRFSNYTPLIYTYLPTHKGSALQLAFTTCTCTCIWQYNMYYYCTCTCI